MSRVAGAMLTNPVVVFGRSFLGKLGTDRMRRVTILGANCLQHFLDLRRPLTDMRFAMVRRADAGDIGRRVLATFAERNNVMDLGIETAVCACKYRMITSRNLATVICPQSCNRDDQRAALEYPRAGGARTRLLRAALSLSVILG